MNWKLIAPLAILGPLMGVLIVTGAFPQGVDRFAWSVIVMGSAFVVARREPAHVVKNSFVIGGWNGASATLVQALFTKELMANNPWMVERFAHAPQGFDMQFFIFMLVPFIGVTGGGMTALVGMLFRRALASTRTGSKGRETSP